MSAPKVLISDKISQAAVEIFQNRGIDVDYKPGLTPDALASIIPAYHGLAVRSATKATAEIIAQASNLKVIGRAGIGVDNIDVSAATAKGVVVMNTPFGNATTTAEHAIAMMFALARQIPLANASTQAGKWEKSRFMGQELTGKTLGVVGCGNIGRIVVERALGLKLKVIAFDPFLSEERAKSLRITKVDLETLLSQADIVTLHVPLNDQTRNLIDAPQLASMKPTAFLINCARGGLVNETALKEALEQGSIAGAALDVFEKEPAKENALFGLDSLIATPHLGASTREAQEIVALQVAEQMADFLLTGAITNALNAPSLTAEEATRLQPYVTLAQQLGSFAGQLTKENIESITIEFEGEAADLNVEPVKQSLLQALLAPHVSNVNMVNASLVARERGINVSTVTHERAGDYNTLLSLAVQTPTRQRSIKGTLFGGGLPRIVEIKGIRVETALSPHMLYVTNQDKPGFVGNLGQTLSQAEINIATFFLGRAAQGGEAIALIAIDSEPEQAVMEKLRSLPLVKTVEALSFPSA